MPFVTFLHLCFQRSFVRSFLGRKWQGGISLTSRGEVRQFPELLRWSKYIYIYIHRVISVGEIKGNCSASR